MSNGEPQPNASDSWVNPQRAFRRWCQRHYPDLDRRIDSLARGIVFSPTPSCWADEFWQALIADPGERRRARTALDAALRRDLVRNIGRAYRLSPTDAWAGVFEALETAAVSGFFLGLWLGQLGFAKVPDVNGGRWRGGEEADPSGLDSQ